MNQSFLECPPISGGPRPACSIDRFLSWRYGRVVTDSCFCVLLIFENNTSNFYVSVVVILNVLFLRRYFSLLETQPIFVKIKIFVLYLANTERKILVVGIQTMTIVYWQTCFEVSFGFLINYEFS